MTDISRDLDRYLKRRKGPTFTWDTPGKSTGPGLWSKMFPAKADDAPRERLSPEEMRRLESMETQIKKGEQRIEAIEEVEHELEEEQERKVSIYHQLKNFFARKPEEQDDMVEMPVTEAPQAGDVTADFKELARIQVTWLERLPTRVKQEFLESDDYRRFTEVLQRRGVARRK